MLFSSAQAALQIQGDELGAANAYTHTIRSPNFYISYPMRGLEALLGLLDAADGHGRIQEHHALDDKGGAAFQLRVLGYHHVDILKNAG